MIIRVYQDVNLGKAHDGLGLILKEDKVKLGTGDFAIFINRRQDKIKCLTDNNVLCYYRSPHGRLTMQSIQFIPEAFNGNTFEMTKAIEKTLSYLKEKRHVRH
jgi:hypothetical protein